MKKREKKLVLNRETLRHLTERQMGRAAGGLYPSAYPGCTNNTTQGTANCPSDFCNSASCGGDCGNPSEGIAACPGEQSLDTRCA
jgi:hypothetical protein